LAGGQGAGRGINLGAPRVDFTRGGFDFSELACPPENGGRKQRAPHYPLVGDELPKSPRMEEAMSEEGQQQDRQEDRQQGLSRNFLDAFGVHG